MLTEHYWTEALHRSKTALMNNSLVPLRTELTQIPAKRGEAFELRKLIQYPTHLNSKGPKQNPFKPWDKKLEVSQIGSDHVLILNKYPVQQGHMLLITREWAPQNGWISYKDWQALLTVDKDTNGLWFFNSSQASGASQPHRHLQLLRRNATEKTCPRDKWFLSQINNTTQQFSKLSLSSVVSGRTLSTDPQDLFRNYLSLANILGLGSPNLDPYPKRPYNLLLTKDWIALIRRSTEGIGGFSINALGFAGYLLATEKSDLKWLKSNGPEALLEGVVEKIQ